MNNTQTYGIEVFSDKENLTKIEKFIDEVSSKLSINEELYGKIFLAIMEAANNAITHGNKEDSQKIAKVIIEKKNKKLIVIVKDEGNGFDYENIPDPTLPENIEKPDGRGVFVIRNLADETIFKNNGAEIQIRFNL